MNAEKKYDVLSICNVLIDIIYRADDVELAQFKLHKGHMALVESDKQMAILQHFAGRETTIELGGSSLNTIRALAMLKKKTVFAGMLANDRHGHVVKKRMDALHIKSALQYTDKDATGTCVVLVTEDGERTMNTHLGASRLFSRDIIPVEDLRASRVFHFSGYQWDTEDQMDTIEEAIRIAKASGCKVSFDLADPFVVSKHKREFLEVIKKHVDIVFANEEEAKLLYGPTAQDTAKFLAKNGAIAVIKLGPHGALIQTQEELVEVPPVRTLLIDTTGAGDMFAAGFLYGYLSNFSLAEAGNIGAFLASDVISRYGAHLSDSAIQSVLEKHSKA